MLRTMSSLTFNVTSQKRDIQLFATKLKDKMHDPHNAKEHHQSFIRKKNTKFVKQ